MIAGLDVSELLELALLLIAVGAVLVMPTSLLTAPPGAARRMRCRNARWSLRSAPIFSLSAAGL